MNHSLFHLMKFNSMMTFNLSRNPQKSWTERSNNSSKAESQLSKFVGTHDVVLNTRGNERIRYVRNTHIFLPTKLLLLTQTDLRDGALIWGRDCNNSHFRITIHPRNFTIHFYYSQLLFTFTIHFPKFDFYFIFSCDKSFP